MAEEADSTAAAMAEVEVGAGVGGILEPALMRRLQAGLNGEPPLRDAAQAMAGAVLHVTEILICAMVRMPVRKPEGVTSWATPNAQNTAVSGIKNFMYK